MGRRPVPMSWSAVADYLEHQDRGARDAAGLVASFKAFVAPFGVDTFACGKLHLADRRLSAFFVIDWPDDWRDFYIRSGMINRDPLLDHLSQATGAFTWSELRRARLLNRAGTEALRGAADHGWSEGLVVPVETGSPVIGLISLVARREAFTVEERTILTLVGSHFYQHAKTMALASGHAVAPAGLTAREITCLQRVALGLSDRRIGEDLGISTATAHEHVESAKTKLNATTRSAMVAMAIALAIIRPL